MTVHNHNGNNTIRFFFIGMVILILCSTLVPCVSGYSTVYNGPLFSKTKGEGFLNWPDNSPVPSGEVFIEWQIQTGTPQVYPGDSFEVTLDIHTRYRYENTGRQGLGTPIELDVTMDCSGFGGGVAAFPPISTNELLGIGSDGRLPFQNDLTINRAVSVTVPETASPGTYSLFAESDERTDPIQITIAESPEKTITPTPTPTTLITPTPTGTPKSTSPASSPPKSTTKPSVSCTLTGPYASESEQFFTIQPGQTLSQDYSVTNTGPAATGLMTAKFSLISSIPVVLGQLPVSSLSPSQTSSGTASFVIPPGTPAGDYRPEMTVTASDGSVLCSMYYPRSVHVGGTGGADLVPMVLSIPPSARSGQPVTLGCSVKNTGNSPAGSFQVSFYLLGDRSISASTPVFAQGSVSGLAAGATQQVQGTGTAPSSAVAEYYIVGARVDSGNSVSESGENNNDIFTESQNLLTIQPGNGPDLTGSFGTPSTTGGMLTIPYSIQNLKPVIASGVSVRLVLMESESGSESTLNTVTLPDISGSQVYTAPPYKVSLSTLETGDYYLRGYITCPDDIQSSNDMFRTMNPIHITGSGKKPDFMVDLYGTPAEATAGATVTIQDTAFTLADAAAGGPVTITYYLSSDASISMSDPVLGSRVLPLLVPNQPQYGNTPVTIPAGTATGNYYFGAIIDPENAIPEKNEDNNVCTNPRSVHVTGSSGIPLAAAFTVDPSSGPAPLLVTFTDQSAGNPDSDSWDFGDGGSSADRNPAHTYTKEGTYTVTLTIQKDGKSASATKVVTVTGGTPLTAAFDMTPESGTAPLTVQFTDTTTGDPSRWLWNFGDGKSSQDRNPSHIFTDKGAYTITLTAEKDDGRTSTATATITVTTSSQPVKANFFADPESGEAPLSVTMTDSSTGDIISIDWDLGDGQHTSAKNPEYTYSKPGTYEVTLAVKGASGETDTMTKTITVTGGESSLKAGFSYEPAGGSDPRVIRFTDQSTGNVDSYRWDFGDGGSSTERNPEQAYTKAGTYTVTLTVTNTAGSDMISRSVTVGSGAESGDLVASFTMSPESGSAPLTVFFTDTSTGAAVKRTWIFNDKDPKPVDFGGERTQRASQYAEPGTFQVTLTITDASGKTSTATRTVTVTSEYPYGTGDITTSITGPSIADPGDAVDLSVTVTYQGSTETPPALSLRIVISEDSTIELKPGSRDQALYEGSTIQLGAGVSQKTVPFSIMLPATLTAGKTYYLGVQVIDSVAQGAVEATGSYPVTMGEATGSPGTGKNLDFLVSLSGADTTGAGRTYVSSITVSNKGTDFMYPVDVNLYLSSDQQYQAGQDTFLATSPGFGPQPGNSYGQDRDLVIPVSVSPGSYYLIGYVNEQKTLAETDYTNNFGMKPITVTGSAPRAAKPATAPPVITLTPTMSPTPTPEPTLSPAPVITPEPAVNEVFKSSITDISAGYNGNFQLIFTIFPSGEVKGSLSGHGAVNSENISDTIDSSGSVSGTYDSSSGTISLQGDTSGNWQSDGQVVNVHWTFEGHRSGDSFTGIQTSDNRTGDTCSVMTREITARKVSSPEEAVSAVTYSYHDTSCTWTS